MDIKDFPTDLDNWKYLSDNWNVPPHLSYRKVKFEPSFTLKGVVGTENPVNEYQIINVGRWIFSSDKWKLHSLVRQDNPRNKLMSNLSRKSIMEILTTPLDLPLSDPSRSIQGLFSWFLFVSQERVELETVSL